MKGKVAIYHPFNELPDNYSLSHVVKEQMLMLTEHGYEVHFITSKGFKSKVPSDVEVYPVFVDEKNQGVYVSYLSVYGLCFHP